LIFHQKRLVEEKSVGQKPENLGEKHEQIKRDGQ